MKKYLFVAVGMVMGVINIFGQSGEWSGDLSVQGMKIPLVFHLDAENPTLDSPSQGAKGIPMSVSMIQTDSIAISIPAIGATFNGRTSPEQIVGKFTQRGFSFPLTLLPGEKKLSRPQAPQAPFPYQQEEVSFANGDATLKGTLTLPENYNKETPVVIMITGSGLQNRDEEIAGHKPFAVIADALARNGIASLRYDDRGFGESTGDAANSSIQDFKNDALAGIELLRNRFNRVGVLGHSEGGTIGLMLGEDHKVDFIVSLAGMITSGKETLIDQNRYLLTQSGVPKETVEEYCNLLNSVFEGDEAKKEKINDSSLPLGLKQNLQEVIKQVNTPYLKDLLSLDIRPGLRTIDCPVLALNGTKDTQVFFERNLGDLQKGLRENKHTRIEAMEGLNHLFQHCETGAIFEYSTIDETISPEVLEIIIQWIKTSNQAL